MSIKVIAEQQKKDENLTNYIRDWLDGYWACPVFNTLDLLDK